MSTLPPKAPSTAAATPPDADARPARERVVEAVVAALRELTPADLVTAIGTREIARRAGTSTATLFYHFKTVEDLAEAVVGRVFHQGNIDVEAISDRLAEVQDLSGLPVEAARRMHGSEFRRLTGDAEMRVRLGLWALGGTHVDATFRDFLRSTEARIYDTAERLFASWGRELRPPYDQRAFHAAQVALLSGASVRHLVDPEVGYEEWFVVTAASMTVSALRVVGDRRDMDDRLAEMNYYPVNAQRGRAPTDRRREAQGVIVDAAARLFGSRGYDDTTVAMIARGAGVSSSTVFNHFATKERIAIVLLRAQAADHLEAHPGVGDDAVTRLTSLLASLAGFVLRHADHAPPYLSALVCHLPDAEAATDPIRAAVRAAVVEVDGAGWLRDGLGVDLATHLLVVTTFDRVLADPSARPGSIAALAASLVLLG